MSYGVKGIRDAFSVTNFYGIVTINMFLSRVH